jgi:hypothetical protein
MFIVVFLLLPAARNLLRKYSLFCAISESADESMTQYRIRLPQRESETARKWAFAIGKKSGAERAAFLCLKQ